MPADRYFEAVKPPPPGFTGERPQGLAGQAAAIAGSAAGRHRIPEPGHAAILAVLPVQDKAGLYLEYDGHGDILVLRQPAPGSQNPPAIEGKAVPDGKDGWDLGCQACKSPVEDVDAGMCGECRQRLMEREQQEEAMWADLRGDRQA